MAAEHGPLSTAKAAGRPGRVTGGQCGAAEFTGAGDVSLAGRVQGVRTALFAAGITMAAFCAGDAVASQYPFGPRTRDINDLGNQFVPFHAHLWDLLRGRTDGGWLLNWQSGYGSSFLPDFGTYLSSPFAPLVALFPRGEIDLAVYVVTVLKLGAAAAAMASLLPKLHPGPRWSAAYLGACYALCGWTLMLASYNPMWLDGLIAFPLLCLVGEWARQGRRPVAGILVVALCWAANFYTAYMATIGAVLVLAARMITEPVAAYLGTRPGRAYAAAVGRAALTTVLGVGLTAPLLLTVVKGTRLAYPGLRTTFRPVPWSDLLMRMLPGTYGFGSPSMYVGTGALLAAFALPLHPAVPRRTRVVWTVLVVVVAASFQWRPTHLLWHAFTTPNGSPYRQTFVLSGVMVIAAWLTLAHGLPGWRPLSCGAGAVGLLAAVATLGAGPGLAGRGTYPLLAVGLTVSVGTLLALRGPRAGLTAAVAVGVLITAQVGELALSNAWIDRRRLSTMDDYAVWGSRQDMQRAAIAGVDGWPRYRTDPGREQTVGNDPLAVGGQGAQYYSSLTADVWTRTLSALGGGWTSRGRSPQSLDNPVTDVLFSVGARVHSPPDPHRRGGRGPGARLMVTRRQVPPLVTVRPAPAPTGYGHSPYRNQELLLGSSVYTAGRLALYDSEGKGMPPVAGGGAGNRDAAVEYRIRGVRGSKARSTYRIESMCPTGSQVYFWAPDFWGDVRLAGAAPVRFSGDLPKNRAPVQLLGTAPPGGHLTLRLDALPGAHLIEADGIGCLSLPRLAAARQRLTASAAAHVTAYNDGISARFAVGTSGVAVVAAPAITGWSCSVDGGPARPGRSYLGLLSVPLGDGAGARAGDGGRGGGTEVSCAFTPPGLHTGEAVGGMSLVGVAGVATWQWCRRRRRGGGGERRGVAAADVTLATEPGVSSGEMDI